MKKKTVRLTTFSTLLSKLKLELIFFYFVKHVKKYSEPNWSVSMSELLSISDGPTCKITRRAARHHFQLVACVDSVGR